MSSLTTVMSTDASAKLKEICALVDEVYKLKALSEEAENKFKKAKNKLSEIMTNADVDKVMGDTCTASLELKTSVSCPKEDDKKIALFKYLASKDHLNNDLVEAALLASPTLLSMLTINAKTFSSWHDKEVEAKVIEGDVEFKLPMVEPYSYYSVGLRKRAGK